MFDKIRRRDSSKSLASNPSYFSKDQFGSYLKDLRGFRQSRPDISRVQSTTDLRNNPISSTENVSKVHGIPRSSSAMSQRSETSNLTKRSSIISTHRLSRTVRQASGEKGTLTEPVVSTVYDRHGGILAKDPSSLKPGTAIVLPGAQYIERGSRWMERQENMSLRMALEDMDAKNEDELLKAAREEATQLVWHHQNPEKPYPLPESRPDYKVHLRKGSHARSHSISYSENLVDSLVAATRSLPRSRNVSGSSTSTTISSNTQQSDSDESSKRIRLSQENERPVGVRTASQTSHKRKSSGSRRAFSNQSVKSLFRNPEDKIYEEPEELSPIGEQKISRIPSSQLRGLKTRQPQPNVQSLRSRFDRIAIDESPKESPKDRRSRSRDPEYTTNTLSEPNKENAAEIRGSEIRDATSMRRKDRSPNLPLPTLISNKSNRPIVSFEKQSTFDFTSALPGQDIPAIENNPIINVVAIPTINLPEERSSSRGQPPSRFPAVPRINPPHSIQNPYTNRPSSNTPNGYFATDDQPRSKAISNDSPRTNTPSIVAPSINIQSVGNNRSVRPLPQPVNRGHPNQVHQGNFTTQHTSNNFDQRRIGASCMQCDLPISGKVLAAAGYRFHPECFICFQCGEGLELVAFYPEPEKQRNERLTRIQARCRGVRLPEVDGQTAAEDGDIRPRFYCHLDFHELFSPRCRSCKTPIEGEVIVACGAEWHVGHFFCAECGDPFDSNTPFVEKEGYAWCINCHTNRYSAKCKKCRRPVAKMVINALGAEWHEECFNCSECGSQFDDGQFFVRADCQLPVCVPCEQRRLKA